MKNTFNAILAVALLAGSMAAHAIPIVFTTSLSGANEDPPNGSPGSGDATVTIDDLLSTMRVEASFSGLIAGSAAAHIHCCTTVPAVANAGVATQTPTFTGFPTGVTSGTYDMVFDMTLASSYNPAFVTANGGTTAGAFAALVTGMNEGRAYVNIHSSEFPAGEIRGFLQETVVGVPEPATLVLVACGLAGLGFGRRRRRI